MAALQVLLLLCSGHLAILASTPSRDPVIEQAEKAIDAGNYAQAVALARQARVQCEHGNKPRCVAQSYAIDGLAALYEGRYAEAEGSFQNALSRFERLHEQSSIADTFNNLGAVAFYRGSYAEALKHYTAASNLLKGAESEKWYESARQLTDGNIAALLQRLGRYREALDLYRRIGASPGGLSASERARVLTNLGALYRRLGDPYKASDTYDSARALLSKEAHADALLGVLKNQGILHVMETGDYAAAHRLFAEGRKRAIRSASARESMQFRMYEGETLFREGRIALAGEEWRSVLAESRRLGTVEEEWKALHGLGRVEMREGHPDLAAQRFEEAATLLESVRGRIAGASLRLDFLFDKQDVYDDWIEAERRQGRNARLLEIAERSRARQLLDQASTAITRSREADAQLRPIREKIGTLARSPDGLLERLKLEVEYDRAEAKFRAQRLPGLRDFDRSSVTVDSLRRRLKPGEGILIYWIGKRRSFLRWISPGQDGIAELGPGERSAAGHVALAGKRLVSGDAGWENEIGWLLPPIPLWRDASVHRLWVVLDGVLSHVSLDALHLPDGPRLVERFSVSVLPAAAFLRIQPSSPAPVGWPWQRQMIAFGDPAPGTMLLPADRNLPSLPGAADELRSLQAILPGGTLTASRNDLTRQRLIAAAPSAPLMHLATHAIVDPADPARSRFLLTDGYLFAGDIPSLQLTATQLVTLSACQTEEGLEVRGEGAQGLGKAFLAAGARAAVSTRWAVEDRATALWMRLFYRHLSSGDPPAKAMQEAKRSFLLRRDAYREPRYWAAFTLIGDGHSPVTRYFSWSELLAAVGALTLFLLTVFRLSRFSARSAEPPPPASHPD